MNCASPRPVLKGFKPPNRHLPFLLVWEKQRLLWLHFEMPLCFFEERGLGAAWGSEWGPWRGKNIEWNPGSIRSTDWLPGTVSGHPQVLCLLEERTPKDRLPIEFAPRSQSSHFRKSYQPNFTKLDWGIHVGPSLEGRRWEGIAEPDRSSPWNRSSESTCQCEVVQLSSQKHTEREFLIITAYFPGLFLLV